MQPESESKRFRDANSSESLEWFFENPDFKDWDSSSSTEILQLGSKSRAENRRVYGWLLQTLLGRGATVIRVSCSVSLGFDQLQLVKPDEQACRVVRLLIRQLMDDDVSRLRYAMEHCPIEEIIERGPFSPMSETSILERLVRVLFYCMAAKPDQRFYLLVDGIDILGSATSELVKQLEKLHFNLKDSNHLDAPVAKIFFDTPPRSSTGPSKGNDPVSDRIRYIEKDKEMRGMVLGGH